MATNNVINQKHPIPAFNVNLASTVNDVTGDGTVYVTLYDNINTDSTSSYNAATGIWTCPQAGNYILGVSVDISTTGLGTPREMRLGISCNAAVYYVLACDLDYLRNVTTAIIFTGSLAVPLAVGDPVFTVFSVVSTGKTIDVLGSINTRFYGYLIS